jgi:hypothetical protein
MRQSVQKTLSLCNWIKRVETIRFFRPALRDASQKAHNASINVEPAPCNREHPFCKVLTSSNRQLKSIISCLPEFVHPGVSMQIRPRRTGADKEE